MEQEILKHLWLSANHQQKVDIDTEKLLQSITLKLFKMEKQMIYRSKLETLLAIAMTVLFGWWMIVVPFLAVKVGSAIMILGCLLVIYKLKRSRTITPNPATTSDVKHYLAGSLHLVEKEIKLQKTMVWWYLLPFFIGIVCFFYAYLPSIISFFVYTVLLIFLYGYIWYKSKISVLHHLFPIKEVLIKMLADLSGK